MGLGFHVLTDASKDSSGAPLGIFGGGGYHTTTFWVDPANSLYGLFMTRRYPFLNGVEDKFMSAYYGQQR
jgi:CubicO group peptidase (beta-lactamase class C family)